MRFAMASSVTRFIWSSDLLSQDVAGIEGAMQGRIHKKLLVLGAFAALAACGGGGDGGSGAGSIPTGGSGWVAGVFAPAANFAAQCAAPRSGFPDVQGSDRK